MTEIPFGMIIYLGGATAITFLVVVCIGFGRFMAHLARGWRPEEPTEEEYEKP